MTDQAQKLRDIARGRRDDATMTALPPLGKSLSMMSADNNNGLTMTELSASNNNRSATVSSSSNNNGLTMTEISASNNNRSAMTKTSAAKTSSTKKTSSSTTTAASCMSIAVTSGKGGVGKTTLALVLASSIAKLQKKVLLLDADLGLANIHILLGIAPKFNISHVVSGECGLNDIIIEAAQNVYLAPGASGLEQLANIDAGRLEKLRMDFMRLESQYDFLIMDTGAGIGSAVTGFARHADLVLLVMTPDPSSLADAYAMVKVLYDKGNKNIAVIVNTAANEREGRDAFDKLNTLVLRFLKRGVELYAILPSDGEVKRFGRRQIHLAAAANSKFYGMTGMVANKICGAPIVGRSFFSRLFGGGK